MFEQVLPPAVRHVAHGHVVRHDVEHHTHAPAFQSLGKLDQGELTTQIVADPRVVADVVTVKAARPGLQDRRGVDVADAKVM
jgi:hypothetical protein